ncbi:MAG: hypothetical protein ACYS0G_14225 [Planctomycetota bacterium]
MAAPRGSSSGWSPTTLDFEPPGGVVKHNQDRDPDRYRIVLKAPL